MRVSPQTTREAIAYYRVSTERQKRSGLGIEAQRAAVERFTEAEGILLAVRRGQRAAKEPMLWIGDRSSQQRSPLPGSASAT
jgi:hypothetical protein